MSYAAFVDEHRRLAILQSARANGGEIGERVLLLALREEGFPLVTAEQVRADFLHIEAAGCGSLRWLNGRVAVVALTDRGEECAAGRVAVDGIARPARVG